MDAIDDLNKLTTFLENKDDIESSDSESAVSDEIVQDYVRLGEKRNEHPFIGTSKDGSNQNPGEFYDKDENIRNIINSCTDSLLKNALIANVKKRRMLEQIYEKCQSYVDQAGHFIRKNHPLRTAQKRHEKQRCRSRLGMPYFKDKNCFPSPLNKDSIKMKENGQMLWNDHETMTIWTSADKNKLAKAVYDEVRVKKLAEINKQIIVLQKQDENIATKSQMIALIRAQTAFRDFKFIDMLAEMWNENSNENTLQVNVRKEIKQIRDKFANDKKTTKTKNKMVSKLQSLEYDKETIESKQLIIDAMSNWEDIDWLRISVQVLNGRHTDCESRAKWSYYMSPKFSKHPWTLDENKKLQTLVRKHDYQNWDAISSELGTNRSSYQCCVHFESTLSEKFNRDRWSKKEDELLKATVNLCSSVSNRIPWAKVAYYFKNRTKIQIYNRYKYALEPKLKKGQFSIAEDVLLIVLARLYNKDFSKISVYFPTRHAPQLRSRSNTMMKNNTSLLEWTIEEDARIIEHVDKYGEKRWNKLDLERNAHCSRHRYQVLRRWFKTNPDGKLEDVIRRKKDVNRLRKEQRLCIIDLIVNKIWIRMQEATDSKEKERFLSVDAIEQFLKEMPENKKQRQRKIKKSRSNPMEERIDMLLRNLFKSTYKHIGRTKSIFTQQTIDESAKQVDLILQLLQANLQLPAMEEIEHHPELNYMDKRILQQLIINRETNLEPALVEYVAVNLEHDETIKVETNIEFEIIQEMETSVEPVIYNVASTSHMQSIPAKNLNVFPPNPETLVGFRGLLLLYSTWIDHAKGKYAGSKVHLDRDMNKFYEPKPLKVTKKIMNDHMHGLVNDADTRGAITNERQLFANRFRKLFHWPCIMSENRHVPSVNDTDSLFGDNFTSNGSSVQLEMKPEDSKQPIKKGRPIKKSYYKVDLMNRAKLLKKRMSIEDAERERNNGTVERNLNNSNIEVNTIAANNTVELDEVEPFKEQKTEHDVKKINNIVESNDNTFNNTSMIKTVGPIKKMNYKVELRNRAKLITEGTGSEQTNGTNKRNLEINEVQPFKKQKTVKKENNIEINDNTSNNTSVMADIVNNKPCELKKVRVYRKRKTKHEKDNKSMKEEVFPKRITRSSTRNMNL